MFLSFGLPLPLGLCFIFWFCNILQCSVNVIYIIIAIIMLRYINDMLLHFPYSVITVSSFISGLAVLSANFS